MSIDNARNKAFWDKAARSAEGGPGAFAGMLMHGNEFAARCRCHGEQEHLLELFTPTPNASVLEIGSGGGRWGLFFADKVRSFVGLDLSAEMVKLADRESKRRGLTNVTFHCSDLPSYETQERFDLVYFSGVLQYMDDETALACIRKASGLLSDDGIILSRDSIQTERRVEETGQYPVIYRLVSEYVALFQQAGYELQYNALSYNNKRFTGLAGRLYALPLVTYTMACAIRDVLGAIDSVLGHPSFLKTSRHKAGSTTGNPREHRFFKYAREE